MSEGLSHAENTQKNINQVHTPDKATFEQRRIDFQMYLIKMCGIKHEDTDHRERVEEWIANYSEVIAKVIDNHDRENLRSLIMKKQYDVAAIMLEEILETEYGIKIENLKLPTYH